MLLLIEEFVEELDVINMGVIYGEVKAKSLVGTVDEVEDEEEVSIDFDNRLYFFFEEREIDILKYIRDMVYVEIIINVVCDFNCKGLCLKCGINMNVRICDCSK